GLVDRLEDVLEEDFARGAREREAREAWADHEVAEKNGDRAGSLAALRRCLAVAEDRAEIRRALDDLEGRRLTGDRVELTPRRGGRLIVFAGERLVLGRDPLATVALRSAGVSRAHAAVSRTSTGFT